MTQATSTEIAIGGIPPGINIHADDLKHLDQYFGMWAIQKESLRSWTQYVNKLDLHAHIEARQRGSSPSRYPGIGYSQVADNIALIEIQGTITKYGSSLAPASSVQIRRAVRNAAANDSMDGIMLRIDSPGGTVAGILDLANDIAAAAKRKPVYSYIEDLGASAAYWIASQATKVYSNATAIVGSIGTFAVLEDWSEHDKKAGIKVHVIRAGEYKGMGVTGTAITDSQLSEIQRRVNSMNEFFLSAVATGRRMSLGQVRTLADGRVHIGVKAQRLGLTDGVKSFDDALAELVKISRGH